MVDCGNSRCFHEKRAFRKELLSWSKKIPIAVGLETVAAELGNKETMKTLFLPFNDLESDDAEDWKPSEKCFYCKEDVKLLFEALENLPKDSKDGKVLQENPSLRYLSEILPFCPQYYTHNYGREILAEVKSCPDHAVPSELNCDMSVPQPSSKPNAELKVPLIFTPNKTKKDSPSNGKRAYTEDELRDAVSDIRSGKLGTRRAAVLYGIPRSTLRNKIFKLGCDEVSGVPELFEEEEDYSNESVETAHSSLSDRALQLSDLLQLSTLQYLAPIAMPYTFKQDMVGGSLSDNWEKKLQQIRHKHNLSGSPMTHIAEKVQQHKLKPFLHKVIKKLVQERLEVEQNALHVKSAEKKTSLSALLTARSENSLDASYQFHLPKSDMTSAIPISDIKVPSYLPTIKKQVVHQPEGDSLPQKFFQHSPYKYENTKIGDTLKDIIVKTISEKVRCKLEASDFGGFTEVGPAKAEVDRAKETIISAFSLPENTPPPVKKIKREIPSDDSSSRNHSNSCKNNASSQTKKTRPKRGQYRKYNSQLLTEAVRAVQRGEMSVHRAGSYYGVPHSTLEYKVKERHLLRQKKIKEQQLQKQQQQQQSLSSDERSTPTENIKTENVSATSNGKKPDSKPSPSVPPSSDKPKLLPKKEFGSPVWLPHFASSPSSFESAAALRLFGGGLALSTPASELLRKLQHKVQNKSGSSPSQESNFSLTEGSTSNASLRDSFLFLH